MSTTETTSGAPDPASMSVDELRDAIQAAEQRAHDVIEAGRDAVRHGAKPHEMTGAVREAAAEVKALREEVRSRRSLRLNELSPEIVRDLPADALFEDEPQSDLFPPLGVALSQLPREELTRLLEERLGTLARIRQGDTINLARGDRKSEEKIGQAQVDRIRALLTDGGSRAGERRRFGLWRKRVTAQIDQTFQDMLPPPKPRPKPDPRGNSIIAAVMSSPEILDAIEVKRRENVELDGEPVASMVTAFLDTTQVGVLHRLLQLLQEGDGTIEVDFGRGRINTPRRMPLEPGYRLATKHLHAHGWVTLTGRTITYGPAVEEIAARWNIELAGISGVDPDAQIDQAE